MLSAMIFDIERNSYVDGPGIRTTVFLKGCPLSCVWCHNPESQSFEKQIMFYKSKCIGCGKCREVCPNHLQSCDFCGKCELYCPADARKICGKEYTTDEVLKEIVKDKPFYENSGGGMTLSGGEPLAQYDFSLELLKKAHSGDKKAREELINGNLRLVLSVLQKFVSRSDSPDDLFQVGVVGLIKAIDNFDTSLDVKFSTYAVPMIAGELRRFLRDFQPMRVSRSLRDLAYKAMQAKEQLICENQKEPTVADCRLYHRKA